MTEANARKFPADTAFTDDARTLTHAGFAARARRLASALARRGLRRQERVVVLAQNCLEFFEVYGAGELAGFVTATVNWRLAPAEMRYIINDSDPKVLVFAAEYAETIAALRSSLPYVLHYVCIGGSTDFAEEFESVVASGDADGPSLRARADDIAYLIYTSGTTGRPKGVILGQREELAAAEILGSDMRCCPTDHVLLMMPLFHIGEKILQIAQHWRAGAVHLQRGFDAAAVLRTVETARITITHMAPTMIQTLVETPGIEKMDMRSLRMIVYTAAPMPLPVLRRGLAIFGPIFQQQYGQTEGPGTTLLAHQHVVGGTERERALLTTVGQASPMVEVCVVDDEDRDVPAGEIGKILIRSAGSMRRYWNNSIATIETLRDGFVHTGDVGRLDAEGFLTLTDRKKDMIISGGENIYSREVEEALVQHHAVPEAAVISVPDPQWGESVNAILVLKSGMTVAAADIVEHCRSLIAATRSPAMSRSSMNCRACRVEK